MSNARNANELFATDLADGSFLSDSALVMSTMRMGVTLDAAEQKASEQRVLETFMLRNGNPQNWGK